MSSVFISWGRFIRRSSSICAHKRDILDLHFKPLFKNKFLKPLDYIYLLVLTICFLVRYRPRVCFVALPPTVILYPLLVYRATMRMLSVKVVVIADCHNGSFRGKWSRIPFLVRMLKSVDIALIHNSDLEQALSNTKFSGIEFIVLGDPPAVSASLKEDVELEDVYCILPLSFSYDEPLELVAELGMSNALKELGIKVIATGPYWRADEKVVELMRKSPQLELPGYLPLDEFEKKFSEASACICLTDQENIQLCVVNEAIGFKVVPIISNTKTLYDKYSGVGRFSDNDVLSLESAIKDVINNHDYYSQAVKIYSDKYIDSWLEQYDFVLEGKIRAALR